MRQVPYTMMKFAAFERTVEAIYHYILPNPKSDYNKVQQLGVTFAAGYWAGIFCAVVSHPADTVVSKLNNVKRAPGEGAFSAIAKILKELGPMGVWRGLGARIVMVGTLTAMQWFIYDTFKVYSGLPTSGSVEEHKAQPLNHVTEGNQ
jgi:solute carrier family 25 (mitochondrial phosphate transporter), member 3